VLLCPGEDLPTPSVAGAGLALAMTGPARPEQSAREDALAPLRARLARAEEAAAAVPRLLRLVEAQREERRGTLQELTHTRDDLQQARREEQEALQRIGQLQGELAAARADAAAARRETAQTHALYSEAFSSRSWRWTAPLRGEPPRRGERRRRRALTTATPEPLRALPVGNPEKTCPRVAVVAHLFYPDLWDDLRLQLTNLQLPFDLHVTLTAGHSDDLRDVIAEQFPSANVVVLPNRGRDIAPFAHLLRAGALDGYDALLKLHGKRSHHREDGDAWRSALWHGLLPDPEGAERFARVVARHPDIGALVPHGTLRGPDSLGANRKRVRDLLARVAIEADLDELTFPAGSMYWLDGSTAELLKALDLDPVLDFEDEQAQVDGTTAHAFERVLGVLLARRGQAVLATEEARSVEPVPDWSRGRRPRVLAFYLPQYHRDPLNDTFWGEGFTDWKKVAAARPWHRLQRFPRHPAGELGQYDLSDPAVLPRQAELARSQGVDGFLIYHYWFSGQRALSTPVESLLADPSADVPFALVWANENWTRTWDGLDDEVLLSQDYRQGWEERLLGSLLPALRDQRYVTLDGRPLLVIFKPALIPDVAESVEILRRLAREHGLGELHIAGVLHDRHAEPAPSQGRALDSWMEFPPLSGPTPQERSAESDPARGRAYSYRQLVDEPQVPRVLDGRPVHPGVMPSWDNTPRRTTGASAFPDANPADFRRWLLSVRKRLAATSAPCELVVTVNAWNEWAETAHLEPDDRHGSAPLEAIRSVFGPVIT
jgi:lipopolysaccharide biosynthesis protein